MRTTIQPGSIVVGADGSKHATRAIAWAAEQAVLQRRPLVVLTADGATAHRTNAEALHVAREAAPDVQVTGRTAEGAPADVLAEASAAAGLLVVGSRGHGGFAGLVLGSVSHAVVQQTASPVAVVRKPQCRQKASPPVLVSVTLRYH